MDENNLEYIFIYATHKKDIQKNFSVVFSGYYLFSKVYENVYYDQNDQPFMIINKIDEILNAAGYDTVRKMSISAERYSVFNSLFNRDFFGKSELYEKIYGLIFNDEYVNVNELIDDDEEDEEELDDDEGPDF